MKTSFIIHHSLSYLVLTYFNSFIPYSDFPNNLPINEQSEAFRKELAKQRWYDPIMEMNMAIAVNSPSYRECGIRAAIASCGHMLHYRCMRALMDSHDRDPVGRLRSTFCPVCRRLDNGVVPILAHVLINASWRDRMVMSPSWSPSCKGKSDLQACMSVMEEEDSIREWWYENKGDELLVEAEKENGKKMTDSLGLFAISDRIDMVGFTYCIYYSCYSSVIITKYSIHNRCVFSCWIGEYFIYHLSLTQSINQSINQSFVYSLIR